jgi:hypothetical protein
MGPNFIPFNPSKNFKITARIYDYLLTLTYSMIPTDTASRPDGQGYIDEPAASQMNDLDLNSNIGTPSGSSVEQESEDEESSSDHSAPVERARLDEFAALDQRHEGHAQVELDSESSDWDVDDEDWELANGGG